MLLMVGGLVFSCLMLVVAVLLTFDNDDYRKLLTLSVKTLTGYTMTIEGPFALQLSSQPVLSAEMIRFDSGLDQPPPPVRAIGKLRLQIDFPALITGTLRVKEFIAEDVGMTVTIGPKGGADDLGELTARMPAGINIPVFESVRLRDIQLEVVDKFARRKAEVRLQQLTIDDVKDAGPLFVKGQGAVNDHSFQIEGRLGALADLLKDTQSYPVELALKIVDFQMAVSGTVDHPLAGEGLNLQLSVEEQELANLFDILQLDMPAVGRLRFAATLNGDAAAPSLVGLNLNISDGPYVQLTARGSIPNLFSAKGTYVLIQAACTNPELLGRIFPDNWKVVKEFRFTGTLDYLEDDYTLEDIEAAVVNDKGITMTADGWLRFGDLIDGNIFKAMDVNLKLDSPQTDAIRPLLTDEIPEVGSVTAAGRLHGPIERLALEDLVIRRGGAGPVQVVSRGRIGRISIDSDPPISDIDLDVSIQSEQSQILTDFYGLPLGEMGSVSLTARVTGTTERFQISDLQLRTSDTRGLKTALSGALAFTEQPSGQIIGQVNCELRIDAPSMKAAEPLIRATLFPGLGPISAEAVVTGTTEVFKIENIAIIAGRPERVQIKWNGRIGQLPLSDEQPPSDVKSIASLQAASTSALAQLFGISLPDIGPVRGSWRAIDRNAIIGFEDLKIVAGDGKKYQIKASGGVDSVYQNTAISIDGIDLQIHLRAADTRPISKLLEISLPDLGAVDGRLSLSGGQEALAISEMDLQIQSPHGLKIRTSGAVRHISLGQETTLRDVGVHLTASAPDVSAVPLFTDLGLPGLGAFELSAHFKDRADGLDVEKFEIRTGTTEKTTLHLNGRILDIQSRKHKAMDLQADFKGLLQPWLQRYLKESPAENTVFNGSVRLIHRAGQMRIDAFEVATKALGGLSLQASGAVNASAQKTQFDLQIISTAGNPSAWKPVLGVPLPRMAPLALNGRYTLQGETHIFAGQTRLGNTRFQTNFRGALGRSHPGMDVTLSAPIVYLEDLGFDPATETPSAAAPLASRVKAKAPLPLFDEDPLPLDVLRTFDFSLQMNADRVSGKNVDLNQVGLDVILESGRLRIGPTIINTREGFISYEATLDASSDAIPAMGVKLTAEDMDIDDVLAYLQEPLVVEGQLNLVIDLRSSGDSIKHMASGLTGELSLGLENGRIRRIVDLLAADALDFLFTAPAKSTYTELNCMVARLLFEDGTGTVQVLYLDTPAVRSRGAGTVNLADETLDIVINSTAKRRLFGRSSPVRIKGQLGEPSAKAIPATEAAALAGQILVPFVALPARGLGYLWALMRDDKDQQSPCIRESLPTDTP